MIDNKLCIELLGVGLPNRGAELLARTVMSMFDARYGECYFCSSQKTMFFEKAKVGLYSSAIPKPSRKKRFYQFKKARKSLGQDSQSRRLRSGMVLDSEVDVVLDISGFAYGDFWGSDKAQKRLGDRLDSWMSKNIPLFILPQAFGPFTDLAFEKTLKPALEYAEFVCARDSTSEAYVSGLVGNVKIFPDITFSLNEKTAAFPLANNFSILIPNSKLLESQSIDKTLYFSMVEKFFSVSDAANVQPYLLNHEGKKDLQLCQELSERYGVIVLDPGNALYIKEIIAKAKFVFTSRYHGAVSSISTRTPLVVLGWSHKYEELMREFGVLDLLVGVDDNNFESVIMKLADSDFQVDVIDRLERHLLPVRSRLNEMWEELFGCIDNRYSLKGSSR